jgi:D-alanine-D-alanine ligase
MVDVAATRLVVLYGGRSAEHEVSCVSARTVVAAADPARYRIEVVGIGTDGRWVDATAEAVAAAGPERQGGRAALPEPDALLEAGGRIVDPLVLTAGGPTTVAWPVLHGPMGEDGSVQGLFEILGVAYVGAGVAGSAAAMDKALAKTAFAGAGLAQARWLDAPVDAAIGPAADLAKLVESELGWPVFVKPANMGSTIGVSRAGDPRELAASVELAGRYDDHVVVEEEIRGRELEIGVLGLGALRTSVIGEIVPSHEFYDFDDKYNAGTADLRVPATLPGGVADELAALAVAACRALRVEAMARVDFFFEEVTGRLLVNEINTLPGFTPISMYPRLWEESGLSNAALVDTLVEQALARHRRRAGRRTSR